MFSPLPFAQKVGGDFALAPPWVCGRGGVHGVGIGVRTRLRVALLCSGFREMTFIALPDRRLALENCRGTPAAPEGEGGGGGGGETQEANSRRVTWGDYYPARRVYKRAGAAWAPALRGRAVSGAVTRLGCR